MADDNILDKVLKEIKKLAGIKKFEDVKVLIDADDKFPDDIILKSVVILITCVIQEDDKLYLQISLEETLFDK